MEQAVNNFIRHTITNLEGALEHQDSKLAWAVLTNLSDVVDTYIYALETDLELSDDYARIAD